MLVLLNTAVELRAVLVPLFASVMFLVGGRIPSPICDSTPVPELPLSVLLSPSLLFDEVVSAAGLSVVAVGVAGSSLLAVIRLCDAAVLVTGKKPVPLMGRKETPVPVARAMLRVTVRVADDTVVVRVTEDGALGVEEIVASLTQPTS